MHKINFAKLPVWVGLIAVLFTFLASFHAMASTPPINISAPVTAINGGNNSVIYYFCLVARWWLSFTMILSIVFGVWGAWRMIQKGDKGLDEGSRHMIQYSLIGVALGIVALGIPRVAADFFGNGENASVCSFTGSGSGSSSGSVDSAGL